MGSVLRLVLLVALAVSLSAVVVINAAQEAPTGELESEVSSDTALPESIPVEIVAPLEPRAEPTPSPVQSPPVTPPDRQPEEVRLVAAGGGRGLGTLGEFGYAFIVENPNQRFAAQDIEYQAAVYDAAGNVLKTDSHFVEVLYPGQRVGVGDDMLLPQDARPDRLVVQLRTRRFQPSDPQPSFTSQNVVFRADPNFPKVTGIIGNPYDRDVTRLRAGVVLYDAAGQIVGGGYKYIDFVRAGGQTAVEMSVSGARTPARVELYAMFTISSNGRP